MGNLEWVLRVSKSEFDATIQEFVKNIQLTPEFIEDVTAAVIAEWDKRQQEGQNKLESFDFRLAELKSQAKATVNKIKVLTSEVALKYLEEELVDIQAKINDVEAEKEKAADAQPINIRTIMANIKYYMEHLDELLLQQMNTASKASYFGVIFDKAPTYEEIKYGTQNPCAITGVNELFKLKQFDNTDLVTPRRVELRLPG